MLNGRAILIPALAGASIAICAVAGCAHRQSASQDPGRAPDRYIWLENVNSPRAMAWVRAEDGRAARVLEADPRFGTLQTEALKVMEDPNRLPMPQLRGKDVYNFWRDKNNVHGLLRRTSVGDYSSDDPRWQTVLDIDALGRQEKTDWVLHGLNCLYPGDRYCMVDLSVGGEDASTSREFNLRAGRFVDGGFASPHSKQDIAWEDRDTLLIARDWGPGTMTKSGYP